MKIYIGADHRGFKLKKKVIPLIEHLGYRVVDVGIDKEGVICDYPKISYDVASRVVKDKGSRGILVCMTGIGHSIAANKILGAHAALCYTRRAAQLSREHNNANILVIGAKFVRRKEISNIIRTWLKSKFTGGRHLRRVNQIRKIEKEICKSVQ